jgi:hypothetical protein
MDIVKVVGGGIEQVKKQVYVGFKLTTRKIYTILILTHIAPTILID